LIKKAIFISLLLISHHTFAKQISIQIKDPNHQDIADVIVYLTSLDQSDSNFINDKTVIVSQNDKKFTPYIAVSQQGQNVHFRNQDDITHHIYSVSGKNRFDFKIKSGETKNDIKLNSIGEVAMGCNIHDWMSGYLLVVDTPYFDKTDETGKSIFKNMPVGNYKLTIWHPQLEMENNEFTKNIQISKKQNIVVTLPKPLLSIPVQQNQDEFDFLEGY